MHYAFLLQYHQLTALQLSAGKISLTCDIWDDKSMRAFIGVSAHYITRSTPTAAAPNGTLVLEGSIIGFTPLPGQHRGQDIGQALTTITNRAEISDNVSFQR